MRGEDDNNRRNTRNNYMKNKNRKLFNRVSSETWHYSITYVYIRMYDVGAAVR